MTSTAIPTVPGRDWRVEPAEAHGLDSAKLARAAELVRAIDRRYGFLVVKDGVVVHETYYEGDAASTYQTFSLTKGFGAALFGIAQTKGMLNVKDPVTDWLPYHHADIVEGATIEHILSMTAGHEPAGSTYVYTSGPILNTLPTILQLATGVPPFTFYQQELAAPLGLTLTWPHTEKGWMQIGNRGPLPVMTATHRDLARLGLLWLRRGNWGGRQLIAEEFIDASLRPPFPEANNAYGYLWWLNIDGGQWRDPVRPPRTREGKRIPTAPENVYTGQGARGKLLMAVPDHNLIVVTLGETNHEYRPTLDLWQAVASFLPDAPGR